jgi:hypothetical protein
MISKMCCLFFSFSFIFILIQFSKLRTGIPQWSVEAKPMQFTFFKSMKTLDRKRGFTWFHSSVVTIVLDISFAPYPQGT